MSKARARASATSTRAAGPRRVLIAWSAAGDRAIISSAAKMLARCHRGSRRNRLVAPVPAKVVALERNAHPSRLAREVQTNL